MFWDLDLIEGIKTHLQKQNLAPLGLVLRFRPDRRD